MQKTIIADTSCLILLQKIDQLHILQKVFGQIIITPEINREFATKLPDWICIKSAQRKTHQNILNASLDIGEASAIALALEHNDCLLIIDELKGRQYADNLGIKITGTLGVLLYAKQSGQIDSFKSVLDKIKSTNFRLSPELISELLKKANEL